MKPALAAVGVSPDPSISLGGICDGARQLALRFFGVCGGRSGAPPDRGLWRDLVRQALGCVPTFAVDGHSVSSPVVRLVAYELYMCADRAGVVQDLSIRALAAELGLGERVVRRALTVLESLLVFRRRRPRRDRPALGYLNLGGLSWPQLRARARALAAVAPEAAPPPPRAVPRDRSDASRAVPRDRTRRATYVGLDQEPPPPPPQAGGQSPVPVQVVEVLPAAEPPVPAPAPEVPAGDPAVVPAGDADPAAVLPAKLTRAELEHWRRAGYRPYCDVCDTRIRVHVDRSLHCGCTAKPESIRVGSARECRIDNEPVSSVNPMNPGVDRGSGS